jgi:tetratricopeptide (TPR) repeat protein
VSARRGANSTHPEYRTILAVDIEHYSRSDRTDPVRVELRRRLTDWSAVLLARTGAAPDQWVRQDTGDGWIVSVDPHVPRDLLLTTVLAGLRRRLLAFNRGKPDTQRLRMRLALHAGEVLRDPDPLIGQATNHACRLLDSDILRASLQATTQPLAVIVSTILYEGIIRHAYGGLDPAAWHPVVALLKEGPAPAWVHVAGDPDAPVRAGVVATSTAISWVATPAAQELLPDTHSLPERRSPPSPLLERLPRTGRGPLLSNLPARNPNFTGRADLLDRLHHQLHPGQPTAVIHAQAQALHGLGGIGKTQLALEYAHRHASDYGLVWWVTAEQPAAIPGQLVALARRLDLPEQAEQAETVHALWDALRGRGRWLLIFDNVEYPSDLRPWWPPDAGRVLVTSRNPTWAGLATTVALEVLPRAEAVTFLRRRLGHHDPTFNQLAKALGDLPLALEQAAAYLEETATSPREYLELLGTHAGELFTLGRPATTAQTIATTWAVSLHQLRQHAPAAVDLLVLCAFLAADDIPRPLAAEHATQLPERLAASVADPLAYQQTIAALRRYALVKTGADALSVHGLVQAVVRQQLDHDRQQHWATAALHLVRAAFPTDATDPAAWPASARLLPHALAVTDHATALAIDPETTAWLLAEAGRYLFERADYLQARKLDERALAIREARLGADHPDTAQSLRHLAIVLANQGELDRARPLFERSFIIREARLGPDHPDTATSLDALAVVLAIQGELDRARTLFEHALVIREARLGPDHRNTADSLTNLALVLRKQGDLTGARTLHERALTIYGTCLGPDHPDTATSLDALAVVLAIQGELDRARTLHERALTIREARLGPDHPFTAESLNNLALVLHKQGDLTGARTLHERALTIREARLGPDHSDTGRSRENLAAVVTELDNRR